MTDRIDIALQPGVIVAVIAIFVLITLSLAAAVYPYFRGADEPERRELLGDQARMGPSLDEDEPDLDERIDDFIEDAYRNRLDVDDVYQDRLDLERR